MWNLVCYFYYNLLVAIPGNIMTKIKCRQFCQSHMHKSKSYGIKFHVKSCHMFIYEGCLESNEHRCAIKKVTSLPYKCSHQTLKTSFIDIIPLSQSFYPYVKCWSLCIFEYTLYTLEYVNFDSMTTFKSLVVQDFFDD